MKMSGAAIWINPGVGVLTIIALWPVAIMFMHVRNTLRSLNIIPKYAMYQVSRCVLVIQGLHTFPELGHSVLPFLYFKTDYSIICALFFFFLLFSV